MLDGYMGVGVVQQVWTIDNMPTNNLLVMVRDPITDLPETVAVEVYGGGKVLKAPYERKLLCEPATVKEYFTGCSYCGCIWDNLYNIPRYKESNGPRFCPDCGAENIRWST